jgi:hypothetical protein
VARTPGLVLGEYRQSRLLFISDPASSKNGRAFRHCFSFAPAYEAKPITHPPIPLLRELGPALNAPVTA